MKTTVYISGAITSVGYDVAHKQFMGAERKLKDFFIVKNPINYGTWPKSYSWEDIMRECIKDLLECDAIIMLDGWKKSKGAKLEYRIAKTLKLPIFEYSSMYFKDNFCRCGDFAKGKNE